MYTMRPEDRLWLVTRQQHDLREGIALERAAAAAAAKNAARPGRRDAWRTRALHAAAAARQHLPAMPGRPAVADHGAAR
jgi:hypothetical protein